MLLALTGIFLSLAGPPTAAHAAPDATVPRIAVRADAVRAEQWQLSELDAKAAWQVSTGKGVTVAVIDSGVDGSHPDLAGQVLPGIDLVDPSGGDGHTDPVGHGTTVAALIAGRDDDSRGVIGLAPKSKILPVRVLDEENRYDDALIVAKGVRWAVDNGARVINLSLGGNGDSPALAAALDYAFARDVVVVACTGNLAASSPTNVWYPAREPGVLAVAGMERDTDSLWSGSITGPETVLTAPATGLLGARPGGFWRVQGTSFAAPLVAASAALLRARWPDMSAGDVVNRLVRTARDLGPAGRDDRFGFGLVNPVGALNAQVSDVGRNPLDDALSPGVSGFGPAPGAGAPAQPAGGERGQPGGPASEVPAKWSARPAGEAANRAREELWGGGALFVVLVTGSALMLRRFSRGQP
jgi:type VII secretion-associated serine protease mycosin